MARENYHILKSLCKLIFIYAVLTCMNPKVLACIRVAWQESSENSWPMRDASSQALPVSLQFLLIGNKLMFRQISYILESSVMVLCL